MKHRTLLSAKNKLPTYAKNVIEKNEMYTLSGSEGNVILLSEHRYKKLYERFTNFTMRILPPSFGDA